MSRNLDPDNNLQTILVVEDDDQVRRFARLILDRLGYNVLEASSGPEAICISHSYRAPIAMILTDLVMPEMAGSTLVRQLQEERPDMRILYMSGYDQESVDDPAVRESSAHFINKPFGLDELSAAIGRVLNA